MPWDLVPNAPRCGRRKKHLTRAPALPPVHENPTDDKLSSTSDRSSSSSSTQAPSGIPQHVSDQAKAQTNSRSQDQVVYTNKASSQLDVPPQAKHPRGECSQMDVRSMTVAGVTISGIVDEDPAEYFDSHEDAGKLLDPLVDNAETEEATKAKLKELERLAEFGV